MLVLSTSILSIYHNLLGDNNKKQKQILLYMKKLSYFYAFTGA